MSVTKPSKRSIVEMKSSKIESVESLMSRLRPSGVKVLVKALPLEEAQNSKIIGADKARESYFNYGRGEIVSIGPKVAANGIYKIGMEVYFPPGLAKSPNMPNFVKKTDNNYFLISEDYIEYHLEK